ncbi:helix-turn-helix domain-containing protein [Microvirga guangxiensis]|uniref:Homeodomain-like domain-containing protein n=1 Tax=Microvirga guangxiensis TaxID=549386 RepID=A0A1G5H0D7_9HYPH|nr:Homeodomain-like domain-containing protein [Microvirga guangxiensis]
MRSPRLQLDKTEQNALLSLSLSQPQSRGIALRARIVLLCAAGQTNSAVSAQLGVSLHTVGKWQRRYREAGTEGLKDQARSGKPRQIEWNALAELIESKLASSPPEGERWTMRRMASAIGVPLTTVARTWRHFQIQKHDDDLSSGIGADRGSQSAPELPVNSRGHSAPAEGASAEMRG